jgi:hypothetical protein
MAAFWDNVMCGLDSETLTTSIIRAMIIALMMEAVSTSETSAYETTWRNIPKRCHLQIIIK